LQKYTPLTEEQKHDIIQLFRFTKDNTSKEIALKIGCAISQVDKAVNDHLFKKNPEQDRNRKRIY
jgi:hypothetical protein